MRKILVAIANYESCIAALDLGGQLSQALGADLTILHCVANSSRSHLGSGVATGKLAEWGIEPPQLKVLSQARERLAATGLFLMGADNKPVERHSLKVLAQGLFESHLVGVRQQNIRFRLREGNAVREILSEADDPLYDLIITGTRGHKGLKKLLIGSIAQEVALHAPCSILVAKALKPGLGILVGVTGRETSLEAVRQAGLLAEVLKVPVTLVAIASDELVRSDAQAHLESAKKILGAKPVQVKTQLIIGEPSVALLQAAGDGQMLALGRLRRSKVKEILLGDVSLKILDKSLGPVLIASFPRQIPGHDGASSDDQTV